MRERKLNRLSGYDYSTAGSYFITICIKNRECMFGEILDGEMKLNESGKITDEQWKWLFQQYNYIRMDEYVIMPNHFHGIIHIVGNGNIPMYGTVATVPRGDNDRSLHRKIKPIPELIGAFKTTSSKLIHRNGNIEFHWQKSYHDRIIRNERELYRIQKYITNNPKNWNRDKENQSAYRNCRERYRNCKERSRPFPTTTIPTTTVMTTTQNNIRIMANNE